MIVIIFVIHSALLSRQRLLAPTFLQQICQMVCVPRMTGENFNRARAHTHPQKVRDSSSSVVAIPRFILYSSLSIRFTKQGIVHISNMNSWIICYLILDDGDWTYPLCILHAFLKLFSVVNIDRNNLTTNCTKIVCTISVCCFNMYAIFVRPTLTGFALHPVFLKLLHKVCKCCSSRFPDHSFFFLWTKNS